jgi:hypothetical protein
MAYTVNAEYNMEYPVMYSTHIVWNMLLCGVYIHYEICRPQKYINGICCTVI